jgi:hypothetical protein
MTTTASATPGREALRETLAAIDAKDYQRAGESALRGVATPLRLAGESLAEMLESFARPGDDAVEWRDRVLDGLDKAVPAVLDAVLVLYANVLFHRLVAPKEKPLFDLDVPSNDDVLRSAQSEIASRGAEGAAEHYATLAANESGKLVESVVKVAELWSSCADDEKNLAAFYESAEDTAEQMLSTAKTLRLSAGVFRSC